MTALCSHCGAEIRRTVTAALEEDWVHVDRWDTAACNVDRPHPEVRPTEPVEDE